jgi:putative endopeptidase
MGEDTKVEALRKLDAFRPKIGFPEKWIDYSAVEIDPSGPPGQRGARP